jgi:hypothetical protein
LQKVATLSKSEIFRFLQRSKTKRKIIITFSVSKYHSNRPLWEVSICPEFTTQYVVNTPTEENVHATHINIRATYLRNKPIRQSCERNLQRSRELFRKS